MLVHVSLDMNKRLMLNGPRATSMFPAWKERERKRERTVDGIFINADLGEFWALTQ